MTTPEYKLSKLLGLPETKVIQIDSSGLWQCEKQSDFEICHRCAQKADTIYDHRYVTVRDEPIRDRAITLRILKRRFWCKPCKKPFTESVPGILPRRRTTQRFKLAVFDACETFADLKSVRQKFNVSSDFIYRTYFERLDLKQRMHANRPWPSAVGIDEHGFRKRRFTTMVVAHSNHKRRVIEVVDGKAQTELTSALTEIPGRENVKYVSMDMCDAYRNFTKSFFPNAEIVADKFHILRLLSPALLRKRKEITGTNADKKARGLLLRSAKGLDYFEQSALYAFLKRYPELDEIYHFKEALHGFYRIKGQKRAQKAFIGLIDRMAHSKIKEIQTLRKTLIRWRVEVLNYFKTRITNGPVEGFNNRASLIKRRGYGYKNHKHYRLRILSACG